MPQRNFKKGIAAVRDEIKKSKVCIVIDCLFHLIWHKLKAGFAWEENYNYKNKLVTDEAI